MNISLMNSSRATVVRKENTYRSKRNIAGRLASAAAAFALLAGATVSTAEARVNGPVFDSHSIACKNIQDQLDQLVQDLLAARTDAERDRIRAEGHALSNEWYEIGCDVNFGDWWRLAFAIQSQSFVNAPTQNAPLDNETADNDRPIILINMMLAAPPSNAAVID